MQYINYYSIVFDKVTTENLFKELKKILKQMGIEIPNDWKPYGDHMTVLHHTNKDFETISSYLEMFVGKTITVNIDSIGISDNVIAFGCTNHSQNKKSHITMLVAPNHKPVESNDITDWKEIQTGKYLKGIYVNGTFCVHIVNGPHMTSYIPYNK